MSEFSLQSLTGWELAQFLNLSLNTNDGPPMEWTTKMEEQFLRNYLLTQHKKQGITSKNVHRVLSNAWIRVLKGTFFNIPDLLVVRWYAHEYFWSHLNLVEIFCLYPTHLHRLSLPVNPNLFWIPSPSFKVSLRRQGIAMERAMNDGYIPSIDWEDQDLDYDPQDDKRIAAQNGEGVTPYLAWWMNCR